MACHELHCTRYSFGVAQGHIYVCTTIQHLIGVTFTNMIRGYVLFELGMYVRTYIVFHERIVHTMFGSKIKESVFRHAI